MIILGLDPGVASVGWGVVASARGTLRSIAYGVIKTAAQQPLPQRLMTIYQQLDALMRKYQPDHVALEQLFFCKNVTTAIAVGQARGVMLLATQQHHLPVSEYTPLQVKQTVTSYGRADKRQVQRMVQLTLHLQKLPTPDDAADALAIAICAANHRPPTSRRVTTRPQG